MMPFTSGPHVVNRTRDTLIADQVEVATSFWARGKGLIGRRTLPAGFGLVIKPCGSIHMFFMFMPIDVVHVDRAGRVVKILHEIKPWRLGPVVLKSKWVIELPAGTARATGLQVGDVVELQDGERNEAGANSAADGERNEAGANSAA